MTVGAIQSGANAPTGNSRTTMDTYQFLRLLIVELTSQNPMDPVKDRDFLAQMAQLNTAQQRVLRLRARPASSRATARGRVLAACARGCAARAQALATPRAGATALASARGRREAARPAQAQWMARLTPKRPSTLSWRAVERATPPDGRLQAARPPPPRGGSRMLPSACV